MSLNKFNFRTQSNQMNLIERSKPTLKVDKTLKSFISMQRNTGKSAKNQKRIR